MKSLMPYLVACLLAPASAFAITLMPTSPATESQQTPVAETLPQVEHTHSHDDHSDHDHSHDLDGTAGELIDDEDKEPSPEYKDCDACLFPDEWLRGIGEEYKQHSSNETDVHKLLHMASTADLGPVKVTGAMTYPVKGGAKFLSGLGDPRSGGRRHQGVDLGGPMGRPIVAVWPGRVTKAGQNRLGGWSARIEHPNGYWTYYAHFKTAPTVRTGELVTAGQMIGELGMSGNARGTVPHLHFEVHQGKSLKNPLDYIGGKTGSAMAFNPNVPQAQKEQDQADARGGVNSGSTTSNSQANAYVEKRKGAGIATRAFDNFKFKTAEENMTRNSAPARRMKTFDNLPGVSVEDYSWK